MESKRSDLIKIKEKETTSLNVTSVRYPKLQVFVEERKKRQ